MKKIIVIAGPTASGKTKLAIGLAKKFNTEIINVDSRQCYQELNIAVAKPSLEECAEVKHHFVSSHNIFQAVDAAQFAAYVSPIIDSLFQKNDFVILAGGTGLYINSYLYGLDDIPIIPIGIENEIQENYKLKGIDWLIQSVQQYDPEYLTKATLGEERNTHRLMRALGVAMSSGKSIHYYRKGNQKKIKYEIDFNVIETEQDMLHRNIENRVEQMIKQGLLDEVQSLYPFKNLKPLCTIGYQEFFEFIEHKCSFADAKNKLIQNTKLYAKRQKTWMKKYKEANHLTIEQIAEKYEIY
jgi:tRNA dimethylallyltransferase